MIPVGDLQLHLGVGDSDAELLAQLELAAVAFMERETSRFFGDAAAYTEVIIGNGTPRLWLAERPDDDVLATVLERRYAGGTETTITATDDNGFVLRSDDTNLAQLVRKGSLIWRSGWEYEATYQRGYTTRSAPADVKQAVIDLVVLGYEDSKKGEQGPIVSETLGDYSYRLADTRTTDTDAGMGDRRGRVRHTINNWRRDAF